MPLILGTNSIKDTGYDVDNSLRFNDGSSDSLQRTPSGVGNGNTWTFSVWVKKSNLSITQFLIGSSTSASDFEDIRFNANTGELSYNRYLTTKQWGFDSNTYLRDVSGWYHVVVNRNGTTMNYYLNGVLQTKTNEVTSTSTGDFNTTDELRIGGRPDTTSNTFDGYMAEVCWIDGQQLDPTSFGEFDEDSGIWKPIDVSGLTFGTNGFYLDFEDSSALGNDVSGNNNDFTVNNLTAIDQSTDTCTNNFATLNSLMVPTSNAPTFSEGNCKTSTNNSALHQGYSTIAVTKGKWYAEAKRVSQDSGSADDGLRIGIGVANNINMETSPVGSSDSGHYIMIGNGTVYNGSNDLGDKAGSALISDDGVVGIALDLDNNRISWSFNGAWMTGSDAWSGSSPSSYVSLTDPDSTDAGYFFISTDGSTARGYTTAWNFGGSPAFTISSGNSDANGYGNFEYAVPNGYYSLNSKNLAEYG